jgi:hypothetical protein
VSDFEFVFSLFGLLLGLSLVEVLSGFGKALKARKSLRIGWLTPLLAVLVMLDLTSFWTAAWALRDNLPVKFLILMLLLLFTGAYYLVSTLVFPDDPHSEADYDQHYWKNKQIIAASVFALNLPNYTIDWMRGGIFVDDRFGIIVATAFMIALLALCFARGRTANLILLVLLIAAYPVSGVQGMLR